MMKTAITILALSLTVITAQATGRADGDPVGLTVYFESLCPDSIRFMKEQLYPTWNNLSEIMDVDLNAYGKATDTPTDDGGYQFECQHGSKECLGNLMLACAKKYITDQNKYVNFTLCVMMSEDPPYSGQKCADRLGIDFMDTNACWASLEGQKLLHDIGVKQAALDPALTHVPWMIINDVHNDDIQQAAEFGLQKEICSVYEGTAPPGCL